MSNISQAHDKIFKSVLSDRKNALNLLKNFLPESITNQLDLKELIYEKDTFVQEHLQDYYSDLLVSIPLLDSKQEVKVYFLFEHKSFADPDLPLQLLRYILEIWTQYRKQQGHTTLPLILPLVITHAEGSWKRVKLSDLVEIPDESFKAYLPDFDYLLLDCIQEDIETYDLEVELKSLLLLWKYSRRPNFLEVVRQIYQMLRTAYPEIEPRDFLITLAQYLYYTRSSKEYEAINEIVSQESSGGIDMETIADMLEKRGYEKAYQEKPQWIEYGKLEATQENLMDVATEEFGPLPSKLQGNIRSIQSIDNLRALLRKIHRTQSLDEFTELVNRAAED